MIDHRETPALSADDRRRVEWAYKAYVKGRNIIRHDKITIPFDDPPELQPDDWLYRSEVTAADFDIVAKVMEFSGETLGYIHQGGAWEWVNIYAHFKGVTVCVDHWRFDSRYTQYRNANQF